MLLVKLCPAKHHLADQNWALYCFLTCSSKLRGKIGSGVNVEEFYSNYLMLIFSYSIYCDYSVLLIGCTTNKTTLHLLKMQMYFTVQKLSCRKVCVRTWSPNYVCSQVWELFNL